MLSEKIHSSEGIPLICAKPLSFRPPGFEKKGAAHSFPVRDDAEKTLSVFLRFSLPRFP